MLMLTRKYERDKTPPVVLLRAVRTVKSLRSAAREFNIPFNTLRNYCGKLTLDELQTEIVEWNRSRQPLLATSKTERFGLNKCFVVGFKKGSS